MRILGVLPIPAGHTIEVRFFRHSRGDVDAPVVVDLDDGVTYGLHWHFDYSDPISVDRRLDLSPEVRADLPVVKTLRGRPER